MGKRSVLKGPFVSTKLLAKVDKIKSKGIMKPIKTWSRNSTIVTDFIGVTFDVYDGRKHKSVFIKDRMVGTKLGEYAPTRVYPNHSGNKKAIRK